MTSRPASIGASIASARRRISRVDTKPRVDGRLPRQRFSATDRFSQNESSWWTIATPDFKASVGLANRMDPLGKPDRKLLKPIDARR